MTESPRPHNELFPEITKDTPELDPLRRMAPDKNSSTDSAAYYAAHDALEVAKTRYSPVHEPAHPPRELYNGKTIIPDPRTTNY
jgi:hypothetical protein